MSKATTIPATQAITSLIKIHNKSFKMIKNTKQQFSHLKRKKNVFKSKETGIQMLLKRWKYKEFSFVTFCDILI